MAAKKSNGRVAGSPASKSSDKHQRVTEGATEEATRGAARKVADQIENDLSTCRQTLMCAVAALNVAEELLFQDDACEIDAAAICVAERCVTELQRIEDAADRLSLGLRP